MPGQDLQNHPADIRIVKVSLRKWAAGKWKRMVTGERVIKASFCTREYDDGKTKSKIRHLGHATLAMEQNSSPGFVDLYKKEVCRI
jgi:hypothetical protein